VLSRWTRFGFTRLRPQRGVSLVALVLSGFYSVARAISLHSAMSIDVGCFNVVTRGSNAQNKDIRSPFQFVLCFFEHGRGASNHTRRILWPGCGSAGYFVFQWVLNGLHKIILKITDVYP
jgi:hypothetical protein